jgi:hypothetical protein
MRGMETKTRVPLAYVGYWPGNVIADRVLGANGRLNAKAIEDHEAETLIATLSAKALSIDLWRVELHWRKVSPLVVQDISGNVVISTRQLYGTAVDTSEWDLHPLYTPIHDPVLDGPIGTP